MARLRTLVIAAGVGWAVLFVAVGLRFGLQQYADGSLFSYAVAVQDAWAFHWHNISGRLFVYLFSLLPAETYVGLTGDARGGIALYGFLFYGAQLLGLAATFAADRSNGRIIFAYACASTACLCPLVYGLPTEMWMAHAVFWPALAVCHYARPGIVGTVVVFVALLALMFNHEAAVIFAVAIVLSALLRGPRDAVFRRSGWRLHCRPGDLGCGEARAAARRLFRQHLRCRRSVFHRRRQFRQPHDRPAAGRARGLWHRRCRFFAGSHRRRCTSMPLRWLQSLLGAYWLWFDSALHTDDRYAVRTALFARHTGDSARWLRPTRSAPMAG